MLKCRVEQAKDSVIRDMQLGMPQDIVMEGRPSEKVSVVQVFAYLCCDWHSDDRFGGFWLRACIYSLSLVDSIAIVTRGVGWMLALVIPELIVKRRTPFRQHCSCEADKEAEGIQGRRSAEA